MQGGKYLKMGGSDPVEAESSSAAFYLSASEVRTVLEEASLLGVLEDFDELHSRREASALQVFASR